MSRRTVWTGLALLAIAAAVAASASAHSAMTGPSPISHMESCKVENGRRTGNCPSPCPVHHVKSRMPVTTTSRGAQLLARWYRNNHRGGFVRWTLVPLDKANDWDAHDKGTFEWGCYEAGTYRCSPREKKEHCTHDNSGRAHRGTVAVPKSAPDGEYMLGWTWVGGHNRPNVRFSDYHDCARVRIRGGSPLTASHQPVFRSDSSIPKAGDAPKRCLAHINGVGMRQGRQVRMMEPVGFEGGRRPAPIPTSFWGGSGVAPPSTPEMAPPTSDGNVPGAAPGPPMSEAPPAVGGGGGGVYGLGATPSRSGTVTLGNLVALSVATRSPTRAFPPSNSAATLPRGGVVLVASAAGAVDRVQFKVNGRTVATERNYPYTLGGANASGGALTAWRGAPRGTFTLQVVVRGKRGHVVSRSWRLRSA